MAPFDGRGSTASRLQPLRGGSLLFTTKFPEIPGTHFVDRGRMKGWVDLGATQWFNKYLFKLRGFICLIFSKIHFWLFDDFWYFKLWRIPLCFLFLLCRTFYFSLQNWQSRRIFLSNRHSNEFYLFSAPIYYIRKSSF